MTLKAVLFDVDFTLVRPGPELGPDGYARAEQDLNQSLKLSEDWVPAWIALADLEVRRGHTAKSRSYLDSADKGIQSLQQAVNTKPPPPFQIRGLVIQQDDPNVKPPAALGCEKNVPLKSNPRPRSLAQSIQAAKGSGPSALRSTGRPCVSA